MFRFYRKLQEKTSYGNITNSTDSSLNIITTIFMGLIPFILLIALDVTDDDVFIMGSPELHLLLIYFPIIMVVLFFGLALIDYLIDIHVQYVTRGKKSMNRIIFNYLFPAVNITRSNQKYKAEINPFNCNNFVVPPTLILYTLVLIYAFPVLIWIALFGAIWFGILKVARMAFSVSDRFSNHVNDKNAHTKRKEQ